jgi:hypothetical protein
MKQTNSVIEQTGLFGQTFDTLQRTAATLENRLRSAAEQLDGASSAYAAFQEYLGTHLNSPEFSRSQKRGMLKMQGPMAEGLAQIRAGVNQATSEYRSAVKGVCDYLTSQSQVVVESLQP